jgi:Tol biopolymer transport system component
MPSGTPRWSPDGKRIAFDRFTGDSWDIFVANSDGGGVRQITAEPGLDIQPYWSADGEALFFASDRGGALEVWAIPVNGDLKARPVRLEGAMAMAGVDEEWIYCYEAGGSILKARPDGRERSRLLEQVWKAHFALAAGGAYFVRAPTQGRALEIEFLDFRTGRSRRVGEISSRSFGALSATPDGRFLIYTLRPELESDIMLVDNFR